MFKKTAKILMIFIILILGVSVVIYIYIPTADANKPMLLDYLGTIASGLFSVLCVMITFHYQEVRDNQQALIDQENQMNMIRIENLPDINFIIDESPQLIDSTTYCKGEQVVNGYSLSIFIKIQSNAPHEILLELYRADTMEYGPYAFENYKLLTRKSIKHLRDTRDTQNIWVYFDDEEIKESRQYFMKIDYCDKFKNQYSEQIYLKCICQESTFKFCDSKSSKYLVKNGKMYSFYDKTPFNKDIIKEVGRRYEQLTKTRLDGNILTTISNKIWIDFKNSANLDGYNGGGGPLKIFEDKSTIKIRQFNGMKKGKRELYIIYEIKFENNQYTTEIFVIKNNIYRSKFKNWKLKFRLEKKQYFVEKNEYGITLIEREVNLFQYILLCFERIKVKRKLRKIDSE